MDSFLKSYLYWGGEGVNRFIEQQVWPSTQVVEFCVKLSRFTGFRKIVDYRSTNNFAQTSYYSHKQSTLTKTDTSWTSARERCLACREFRYRGILVYILCLFNISISVSDQGTDNLYYSAEYWKNMTWITFAINLSLMCWILFLWSGFENSKLYK